MESAIDWEDQSYINFDLDAIQKFQDTFPEQAQEVDYSSYNSLMLLNTLAILIMLYVVKVILYMIMHLYVKFTYGWAGGKKQKAWLERNLFFSELH